jgi:hypothetical protein
MHEWLYCACILVLVVVALVIDKNGEHGSSKFSASRFWLKNGERRWSKIIWIRSLLSLSCTSIIKSLLYFHIISRLSKKKEYLPFSVLIINTWGMFTGIGIICTGINSLQITLNW